MNKTFGAAMVGVVLGGAIVACIFWAVSASKSGEYRAGADVQAVSASNENYADTSLRGNELLACKLAYEAAGHEADARAKEMAKGLVRMTYAMDVVPDVPRRNLMVKTPTGDYEFVFGMEFHQFNPPGAGSPEAGCVLGTLRATVADLVGSMRCTRVTGGFFPTADANKWNDYIKLFGETDGVKVDRKLNGQ
jgi:hypothetical protein